MPICKLLFFFLLNLSLCVKLCKLNKFIFCIVFVFIKSKYGGLVNKVFKVIWNHATQNYVVVSELTRVKSKSSSSDKCSNIKNTVAVGTMFFTLGLMPFSSLASTIAAGGGEGLAINIPTSTSSGGGLCGSICWSEFW
uniref:ESPR domain-containing protein n=1 Tax=Glaesserella sp. TaxID=2094731 RepID=UPI0035A04BF0